MPLGKRAINKDACPTTYIHPGPGYMRSTASSAFKTGCVACKNMAQCCCKRSRMGVDIGRGPHPASCTRGSVSPLHQLHGAVNIPSTAYLPRHGVKSKKRSSSAGRSKSPKCDERDQCCWIQDAAGDVWTVNGNRSKRSFGRTKNHTLRTSKWPTGEHGTEGDMAEVLADTIDERSALQHELRKERKRRYLLDEILREQKALLDEVPSSPRPSGTSAPCSEPKSAALAELTMKVKRIECLLHKKETELQDLCAQHHSHDAFSQEAVRRLQDELVLLRAASQSHDEMLAKMRARESAAVGWVNPSTTNKTLQSSTEEWNCMQLSNTECASPRIAPPAPHRHRQTPSSQQPDQLPAPSDEFQDNRSRDFRSSEDYAQTQKAGPSRRMSTDSELPCGPDGYAGVVLPSGSVEEEIQIQRRRQHRSAKRQVLASGGEMSAQGVDAGDLDRDATNGRDFVLRQEVENLKRKLQEAEDTIQALGLGERLARSEAEGLRERLEEHGRTSAQGSLEMQQTKREAVEREMELRTANATLASIDETHRVEMEVLAKDYQAQMERLNADLEETKEHLVKANQDAQKAHASISQHKLNESLLIAQLADTNDAKDGLLRDLNAAQAQIQASAEKVNQMHEKVSEAERAIEFKRELQKQLARAADTISSQEETIASMQCRVVEAEKLVAGAHKRSRKDLEKHAELLNESRLECAHARAELTEVTAHTSKLQASLQEAQSCAREAAAQAKSASENEQCLREQLAELQAALARNERDFSEQIEAMHKEGKARERHVAILEQQIGDLSGRVQSAQAAALQADQQREQAANRAAVSSAAQSAAEVAHAEALRRVEQAQLEIGRATSKADDAGKEAYQARARLQVAEEDNSAAQRSLVHLRAQLEASEREREDLARRLRQTQEECKQSMSDLQDKTASQVAAAQADAEAAKAEARSWYPIRDQLQKQLDAVGARLLEAEHERDQMQQNLRLEQRLRKNEAGRSSSEYQLKHEEGFADSKDPEMSQIMHQLDEHHIGYQADSLIAKLLQETSAPPPQSADLAERATVLQDENKRLRDEMCALQQQMTSLKADFQAGPDSSVGGRYHQQPATTKTSHQQLDPRYSGTEGKHTHNSQTEHRQLATQFASRPATSTSLPAAPSNNVTVNPFLYNQEVPTVSGYISQVGMYTLQDPSYSSTEFCSIPDPNEQGHSTGPATFSMAAPVADASLVGVSSTGTPNKRAEAVPKVAQPSPEDTGKVAMRLLQLHTQAAERLMASRKQHAGLDSCSSEDGGSMTENKHLHSMHNKSSTSDTSGGRTHSDTAPGTSSVVGTPNRSSASSVQGEVHSRPPRPLVASRGVVNELTEKLAALGSSQAAALLGQATGVPKQRARQLSFQEK